MKNTLNREEKLLYLQKIASGEIPKPKRFYNQVIITESGNTQKTLQGDEVNEEFLKSLPYDVAIILPDNGRSALMDE